MRPVPLVRAASPSYVSWWRTKDSNLCKIQNRFPNRWRDDRKTSPGELIQPTCIRFILQPISARRRNHAQIEVQVLHLKISGGGFVDLAPVPVSGPVEAVPKLVLRLWCQRLEAQRLQGTDGREYIKKKN